MIVLFTDFGLAGPYTGQMKAVLAHEAPGAQVVDLFADAPAFDPMLSAYLLAAYAEWFPAGAVFLAVIDPGVGTDRPAVVVEADGKRFVGPGNGLFEPLLRRASEARVWEIVWKPAATSHSFHGRDIFAPVAARLHREGPDALVRQGWLAPIDPAALRYVEWPDDLPRIVYVDRYGNAMTGLRGDRLRSAQDSTEGWDNHSFRQDLRRGAGWKALVVRQLQRSCGDRCKSGRRRRAP